MKLINATPSPFGRKVAVLLKEKGIGFDVQWDVPWVKDTIVADHSPLQQLPILITDSGETIYDSVFILEWIEATWPEENVIPAERNARIKARHMQMLGERLMEIAVAIVFEKMRPEPSRQWLDRQEMKIETGIAEVARVVGSRVPAPGDRLTIGDITLGTTLLMLEFMVREGWFTHFPAIEWRRRFPQLGKFADALDARPSFAETRPVNFVADLTEVVT